MIEQGSIGWHKARLGKVTASRISDIMAKGKSGASSASRKNYMAEKIIEILTGDKPENYTNPSMVWGTEKEPFARAEYENRTFSKVEEVGFIQHPEIEQAGASPDGLVGDDGLIEIKCPNTATHLETLLSGKISKTYLTQMQSQMACTERRWCDFVSFDPRLPENLQMFIQRVNRDSGRIAEIEQEVRLFIAELNAKIKALREI